MRVMLCAVLLVGSVGCEDHLFQYETEPKDGGLDASLDADPGSASLAPAFARWRINEAPSGQAVVELLDETQEPVNLSLSFSGGSPRFVEEDNTRALEFLGAAVGSGGGLAVASGTKLDQLHGAQKVTLEAKYSLAECVDRDPRIFELADGTAGQNGTLALRENSGEMHFTILVAGAEITSRFIHPCLIDEPRVAHWVIDTTRVDEISRVRYYLDGMPTAYTLVGPRVPRDATVDLGPNERRVAIGKPVEGARPSTARIWYVALYEEALGLETIEKHVSVLQGVDD